jgi:hypothetical protein
MISLRATFTEFISQKAAACKAERFPAIFRASCWTRAASAESKMVNPVGFDCISWHFFTEPEQRPFPINFPGLFFTLVSVFLIASEIIKWQPTVGPCSSMAFA